MNVVFTDYITSKVMKVNVREIRVIEPRSSSLAYIELKNGYSYLAEKYVFNPVK